jgi:formamidopyrimidine-DNA glycosylase
MPEMPEVEIVTQRLRETIRGRILTRVQLLSSRLVQENTHRQFALWLKGARVEDVTRRGKYILTHLSNNRVLITHLRMTGRFYLREISSENTPHARAIFWLDDGKKLVFDDQRQFGIMVVAGAGQIDQLKYLKKLAPEPLSEEFSADYLYLTLKRSAQQIKLALLDQRKVAGLGNIYASEALHRAKIDPRVPAKKLSRPRIVLLHREIVAVLEDAIANKGVFDRDSGNIDASYGRYEAVVRVYEREGQPCLTCGTPIRRITQGARSTYFCLKCQKR